MTEQLFNYEQLEPLETACHIRIVGKLLSLKGANENEGIGNYDEYAEMGLELAGQHVGGQLCLAPLKNEGVSPKDFDYELYSNINRERYKKLIPRIPVVRFGAVQGPLLHFGTGLMFSEKTLNARVGEEDGRNTFQGSSILTVEKDDPYKFRGYDFARTIGKPVFYVQDEETVQGAKKHLKLFELKTLSDRPNYGDNRTFRLKPSLGSFAEKLIANEKDMNLASVLLEGVWRNEAPMFVYSYWNDKLSQAENAIQKLALIEFLWNVYGQWFSAVTRPVTDYPPRLTFLEPDMASLKYDTRGNPRYPQTVLTVDPDTSSVLSDCIKDILKRSLDGLRKEKSVNPMNFYQGIHDEIQNLQ